MSQFAEGVAAINSTTVGQTANPSTSTLLAEVDFNGTNATARAGGKNVGVTWIVGVTTTNAIFLLEQSQSTSLDISSVGTYRGQIVAQCSSGASAQYYTKHRVEPGDRFRVRVASSFAGSANAFISVEPLG